MTPSLSSQTNVSHLFYRLSFSLQGRPRRPQDVEEGRRGRRGAGREAQDRAQAGAQDHASQCAAHVRFR